MANTGGDTPAIMACCGGHAEVLQLLVDADADLTAKGSQNKTALEWVRQRKKNEWEECVRILQAAGMGQ